MPLDPKYSTYKSGTVDDALIDYREQSDRKVSIPPARGRIQSLTENAIHTPTPKWTALLDAVEGLSTALTFGGRCDLNGQYFTELDPVPDGVINYASLQGVSPISEKLLQEASGRAHQYASTYPGSPSNYYYNTVAYFLKSQFCTSLFPTLADTEIARGSFFYPSTLMEEESYTPKIPKDTPTLSGQQKKQFAFGSIIDDLWPGMIAGLKTKHSTSNQTHKTHFVFFPGIGIFHNAYHQAQSDLAKEKALSGDLTENPLKMTLAKNGTDDLAKILKENPDVTHIFAVNPDPRGRLVDYKKLVDDVATANKLSLFNKTGRPAITLVVDETFRYMKHDEAASTYTSIIEIAEQKGVPYCLFYSHNKALGVPAQSLSFAYESENCPEETSLCAAYRGSPHRHTRFTIQQSELSKAFNVCYGTPLIQSHFQTIALQMKVRKDLLVREFDKLNEYLRGSNIPIRFSINTEDCSYGPNVIVDVDFKDLPIIVDGNKVKLLSGTDSSLDFCRFLRDNLGIYVSPSTSFYINGNNNGFRMLLTPSQPTSADASRDACLTSNELFEKETEATFAKLRGIPQYIACEKTRQAGELIALLQPSLEDILPAAIKFSFLRDRVVMDFSAYSGYHFLPRIGTRALAFNAVDVMSAFLGVDSAALRATSTPPLKVGIPIDVLKSSNVFISRDDSFFPNIDTIEQRLNQLKARLSPPTRDYNRQEPDQHVPNCSTHGRKTHSSMDLTGLGPQAICC